MVGAVAAADVAVAPPLLVARVARTTPAAHAHERMSVCVYAERDRTKVGRLTREHRHEDTNTNTTTTASSHSLGLVDSSECLCAHTRI